MLYIPETEEGKEHNSHRDLFTVDPSLSTHGGKGETVEYLG